MSAPVRELALDWMAEGHCSTRDPEAWFQKGGNPTAEERAARHLCQACPVRQQCLDYALERVLDPGLDHVTDLAGVWGGTTPADRKRMVRERGGRDAMRAALEAAA